MPIPSTLYRYRPISVHTLNELANNTIWFSSIENFNDPFEFRFKLGFMEWLKKFQFDTEKKAEKLAPLLDKEGVDENLRAIAKGMVEAKDSNQKSIDEFQIHEDKIRQSAVDTGVCCLSAIDDSILMWGHYANCHKGIVLGYDTTDKPFSAALPVNYSTELCQGDLRNDGIELFIKIYTTKAIEWQYENEFRIVSVGETQIAKTYPPQSLTSVCFGAKCPESQQTLVRKILSPNTNVRFQRANLDTDQFKIIITNE